MVGLSGCSAASDSFECLRTADYEALYNASVALAADKETYGTRVRPVSCILMLCSLTLREKVWGVTIDGEIIPDAPSKLTDEGKMCA